MVGSYGPLGFGEWGSWSPIIVTLVILILVPFSARPQDPGLVQEITYVWATDTTNGIL